MAYTTIDDPSAYFQTALYTGNGSSQNITNDGNSDLQPDFLWIKNRTTSNSNHVIANSSIGWDAPKGEGYAWENGPFGGQMDSSSTGAESTPTATYGYASAVSTDGFTVRAGGTNADNCNKNSASFVGWQWKCNGGTTSNLSGNLASIAQVNTTSGFSIVRYTGSGGNGQSVSHGLGLVPQVIITKARNAADNWYVYHRSSGTANYLKLNTNAAQASSSPYNAADPSSSAFFVSTSLIYVGQLGADYISYVFTPIQGYSKFGDYYGNGQADGTFVYCGFKPAWIMVKNTGSSEPWVVFDTKRNPHNIADLKLVPNSIDPENAHSATGGSGYNNIDILSTGFKCKTNNGATNENAKKFIFMAFAESPFVSSEGIPTTGK